jgi:hypothetical protein
MEKQNDFQLENNVEESNGFARELSGNDVHFGPGAAGMVSSKGDMSIDRAVAGIAKADQNLEVKNGGAWVMVAGGSAHIENGGSEYMVIGGETEIKNGGALLMIAGKNITINQGGAGILLSRQVTLTEGSRVLLNTPQALAFGAALGLVFALVSWLLKKR